MAIINTTDIYITLTGVTVRLVMAVNQMTIKLWILSVLKKSKSNKILIKLYMEVRS